MRPQDELHTLIQSMTAAEKRFFKLNAGRYHFASSKTQYEKLFDAMNDSPLPYDEVAFKKKHKGKTFLKRLADEKNHLKELIISTLRAFNAQKMDENKLDEYLIDARILAKKGLIEPAFKLLYKAKTIAEQMGNYSDLYRIQMLELDFYNRSKTPDDINPEDIIRQLELSVEHLCNEQRTSAMLYRIRQFEITGLWHLKKNELEEYFQTSLASIQEAKLSSNALVSFYLALFVFFNRENQNVEAEKYCAKLHEIYNNRPEYFSNWQSLFLLSSTLSFKTKNSDLGDLQNLLDKIEKIVPDNELELYRKSRIMNTARITYVGVTGDFSTLPEIELNIEREIKLYSSIMQDSHVMSYRCNLAIFYVLNKNYSKAKRQIFNIYNTFGRTKKFKVELTIIRFLEWMCCLEGGDTDKLHDLMVSFKRFIKNHHVADESLPYIIKTMEIQLKNIGLKNKEVASWATSIPVLYSPLGGALTLIRRMYKS